MQVLSDNLVILPIELNHVGAVRIRAIYEAKKLGVGIAVGAAGFSRPCQEEAPEPGDGNAAVHR